MMSDNNKKKKKGCLGNAMMIGVAVVVVSVVVVNVQEEVEATKPKVLPVHETVSPVALGLPVWVDISSKAEYEYLLEIYNWAADDVDFIHNSIKKQVKQLSAKLYAENLKLYKSLLILDPEEASYVDKIKHYQAKHDQDEIYADQAVNQFSWYGGAKHTALASLVESNLKDPSSFEHVKTTWSRLDDVITVYMTYRGTNSFGAVVTNKVKAKYKVSGQLVAGSLKSV